MHYIESNVLCIQIAWFQLSKHFSYLNTFWAQCVRISDFSLCCRWINWQTHNKNWSGSYTFLEFCLWCSYWYCILVYAQVTLSMPFTVTLLCILLCSYFFEGLKINCFTGQSQSYIKLYLFSLRTVHASHLAWVSTPYLPAPRYGW